MAQLGVDPAVLAARVLLNDMRTDRLSREIAMGGLEQLSRLAGLQVQDLFERADKQRTPLENLMREAALDVLSGAVRTSNGQPFDLSRYETLPKQAESWQEGNARRTRERLEDGDRRRDAEPVGSLDPFDVGEEIMGAWLHGQILTQVKHSQYPWWWGTVSGLVEVQAHLTYEMKLVRNWRLSTAAQRQIAISNLSAAWTWVQEQRAARTPNTPLAVPTFWNRPPRIQFG